MAGPKAKPTKNHSLHRAARNKTTNKYERQRRRTEANKAARAAKHITANPSDLVARSAGQAGVTKGNS